MERRYKIYKRDIGYEENSFIYFCAEIGCDESGNNIIIHPYLQIRNFRLSNNHRLKGTEVLDNGLYEYL